MPAALAPSRAPVDRGRPLVISADEELLDDVLRLLGAVGAEPELTAGGPALRRAHREAPLVLIGADALGSGNGLGGGAVRSLPRRPGVVVVARAELDAVQWSVAVELGAERVVVLPGEAPWLLSRAASAIRGPAERGWLVAVGGSCGGSGVSTLAAALAITAAADHRAVLLLDADPAGGGLDLLVGAERVEGLRWPELAGLRGRVAGEALLTALPEVQGLHLLAASREQLTAVPEEALTAVVDAVRTAGCAVVVDLPRAGPGVDAVLADADVALLLVPARLRAACAARLLLQPASDDRPQPWAAARVLLRRMPGGLRPEEVEEIVGRPVHDEVLHDPHAVARGERGDPPPVTSRSSWGRLARRLAAEATVAAECRP